MERRTERSAAVMAAKTILILGAGIGGLVTAHELRRRLTPEH